MCVIQPQIDAYSLPLTEPWQSSRGHLHTRKGWLVMLTDEAGITGYGDCCPMPEAGTETHAQSGDCLHGLAQQPINEFYRELEQHGANHPAACCAMSTALLDLQARQQLLSLGQLLNENASQKFNLNAAAGTLMHINVARLQQLQQEGFQVIKLKVGIANPADELVKLHHLSKQLNPSALLRLDANQAWNPRQAAYFIDGIQGLPVESLEEPLRAPTLADLEKLQSGTSIPLAMDESIPYIGAKVLIQSGVIHRLVLKPMVLGGLQPAKEIAEQAQQADMDCIVTSILESAAGIWATSQLAAAIEPMFPGLAHGLATSQLLSRNTGDPPVIIGGKMLLPITTGSGFHPYAHQSRT
jgi:o-succinylbenzoate synthase